MRKAYMIFVLIGFLFGFVSSAEQLCSSSDNIDYEVKGSVTNYKGETSWETCLEKEDPNGRPDYVNKGRFLIETFCTDGLPDSSTYECENLCVDGACVPLDKSSITRAEGGYNIYTKEGTYTVKRGDVIKINNIEGQIDSFSTDSEGNNIINVNYNTASVLSLKKYEKGYFYYGSIMKPESKNLQMITNEIDEDSAKVTLIELDEKIYYPGAIDEVIAKTWLSNPYDESMNCEELCETYDSKVIINGCLDTLLKACTVAYGTNCKSSDPKQMIKKFDGNLCCCRIGNIMDCTSTDGNNPFAKGRTIDIKNNVIYEDKCEGEGVIDYSCDSFGQVVFFTEPIKCPFGCKDGACIKCPTLGELDGNDYCSEDGPILDKKSKNSYCKFDYECKGSCRDKKCVGIFGRFSYWLKNLFY